MSKSIPLATLLAAISLVSGLALLSGQVPRPARGGRADAAQVLVMVDGSPITDNDVKLMMLTRRIPLSSRLQVQRGLLEQLVDRQLVAAFLESRNIEPKTDILDAQVKRLHQTIRESGQEPREVLEQLGFNLKTLRQKLALPVAWQIYINQIVTADNLRSYWESHREEFDGTEVRASQIVIKAKSDQEFTDAESMLRKLRARITRGELTFADAAREHSQSPSSEQGGDMGYFPFHGTMPQSFSMAAFPLAVGEISQTFRSPFGVHLVTVTDRRAGQLSLEDVRAKVLGQMADELWDQRVRMGRAKAKIEWHVGD